ncbi:MAG TPA: hypothetical protein VFE38_13830 [Edaphobacter sp.]|nr:hypothetical protein [Edaphobacter sp.]
MIDEINEYAGNAVTLAEKYRALSDDQLLQLSIEGGLTPEADALLQGEMKRRSLGAKDIANLKDWEDAQLPKPDLKPQHLVLGYGTRFAGKKFLSAEDERQGIYVATKFVVIRGVSLIPIGSYRVRLIDGGFPSIDNRVPLQGDQVWSEIKIGVFAILGGVALAALSIYFTNRK